MKLPSTYNPIIGISTPDTFDNVRCSLFALKEITEFTMRYNTNNLSDDGTIGLYFLLECISEAMRYEAEQRNLTK
jgi:hypothetical protein